MVSPMLMGMEIEWDENTPRGTVNDLRKLADVLNIQTEIDPKPDAQIELIFEPYSSFETNRSIVEMLMKYFPNSPDYCRVHLNLSGECVCMLDGDVDLIWKPAALLHGNQERLGDKKMRSFFYLKEAPSSCIFTSRLEVRPGSVSKPTDSFFKYMELVYYSALAANSYAKLKKARRGDSQDMMLSLAWGEHKKKLEDIKAYRLDITKDAHIRETCERFLRDVKYSLSLN